MPNETASKPTPSTPEQLQALLEKTQAIDKQIAGLTESFGAWDVKFLIPSLHGARDRIAEVNRYLSDKIAAAPATAPAAAQ